MITRSSVEYKPDRLPGWKKSKPLFYEDVSVFPTKNNKLVGRLIDKSFLKIEEELAGSHKHEELRQWQLNGILSTVSFL